MHPERVNKVAKHTRPLGKLRFARAYEEGWSPPASCLLPSTGKKNNDTDDDNNNNNNNHNNNNNNNNINNNNNCDNPHYHSLKLKIMMIITPMAHHNSIDNNSIDSSGTWLELDRTPPRGLGSPTVTGPSQ